IPVTIIAGPIFTRFAKKAIPEAFTKSGDLASLGKQKTFNIDETPSFGISALTALLPVFIMLISTIVDLLTGSPE
ncbi:GntP family permease, partial [Staphylococcus pseudintermedius]